MSESPTVLFAKLARLSSILDGAEVFRWRRPFEGYMFSLGGVALEHGCAPSPTLIIRRPGIRPDLVVAEYPHETLDDRILAAADTDMSNALAAAAGKWSHGDGLEYQRTIRSEWDDEEDRK